MFEIPTLEWTTPNVSVLFPNLLLLRMKTIVMINKVASTSTASMATIAPATNSPRLFESSDTPIGSRGSVIGVSSRSLISAGSVASIVLTVGKAGVGPVAIAMLLGVGVGSFVGRGACVVLVNWEIVANVNIEDEVTLPMLIVGVGSEEALMVGMKREEGHG